VVLLRSMALTAEPMKQQMAKAANHGALLLVAWMGRKAAATSVKELLAMCSVQIEEAATGSYLISFPWPLKEQPRGAWP
jgi:hypothetical protein